MDEVNELLRHVSAAKRPMAEQMVYRMQTVNKYMQQKRNRHTALIAVNGLLKFLINNEPIFVMADAPSGDQQLYSAAVSLAEQTISYLKVLISKRDSEALKEAESLLQSVMVVQQDEEEEEDEDTECSCNDCEFTGWARDAFPDPATGCRLKRTRD